jgi:N-acetylglucosaminyl-diphospho-decaprenol L-rhamnosyltransferase
VHRSREIPLKRVHLSIIIVSWNTSADLLRCLASIYAHPPSAPFEVLVVDNASSDNTVKCVSDQFPHVTLLMCDQNLGFGRANNRAAEVARGRYWLLLNPDTIVHPTALDRLLFHLAAHHRAGAVGPRLLNPDGTLQVSVWPQPTLGREWWRLNHLDRLLPRSQYSTRRLAAPSLLKAGALHGACMLLRPEALEGALFDEDYFVYSEEIDLCYRLGQAGWEMHWVPEALVTHTGGQSTRQIADDMFLELYRNKVKFFRKRHGTRAAWFYKAILWQAATSRHLLGSSLAQLPLQRRDDWLQLAARYQLLLAELADL